MTRASRVRIRAARRSVRSAQAEVNRLEHNASRRARVLAAVGATSVVVVAALAVVSVAWRVTTDDPYPDSAYLDTARSVVGALIVPDTRNPGRTAEILARSSGEFRDQFAQSVGAYRELLQRLQSDAAGDVDGVAIADRSGDRADVLVTAAVTTDRSSGQTAPAQSRFRVVATIEPDDGRLAVSRIELVG